MRTTPAAFHLVSGFSLISMRKFQFESELFAGRPFDGFSSRIADVFVHIFNSVDIDIPIVRSLHARDCETFGTASSFIAHSLLRPDLFFSFIRHRFRNWSPAIFVQSFACSARRFFSASLSLCGWLPATSNKIFSKLEYFLFSVVHSLAVLCGFAPAAACLPTSFSARGKFAICDNEKRESKQKHSPSAVTCELQFFFADN